MLFDNWQNLGRVLLVGALAYIALVFQFLVSWSSVRASWLNHMVKSEPVMLFHKGHFLPQAVRRARFVEQG